MRPRTRFFLVTGLLAIAILAIGYNVVPQSQAAISSVTPSTQSVTTGGSANFTVNAEETDATQNEVIVTVSGGTIVAASCSVGATACTTFTHSGDGTATVHVTVITDGDGSTGEAAAITFGFAAPSTAQTVNISACQATTAGCTPVQQAIITVSAAATATPEPTPKVLIFGSPTVIACDGVPIDLSAEAFDPSGNPIPDVVFAFAASFGLIDATGPDTATLTIPTSMTPKGGDTTGLTSTVTATAPGIGTGTATIQVRCFAAVVVTASPNVVTCGGTSTITASARDAYGHQVNGVGFHFTTNRGLLTVGPPNAASAEQAVALLTLPAPGSSNEDPSQSATVHVSVGTTTGTIEGDVTVQQYCPTSQTTAGGIVLNASSVTVGCGGRVFVAGTLKDVNGAPVPDGAEVNFIASQGSVAAAGSGGGTSASSTPTPANSPSATASTKGGTVNIVYTADGGASGPVHITAASGASFGAIDLTVNCGGGSGVTPPNTGTGIRPPNTGDGGLR